ncbi:MAG: succinate dehydrogenase [Acidobacteria bacterium]|nr:succinate dehydrogenase [Acidobacteriota bacterium]
MASSTVAAGDPKVKTGVPPLRAYEGHQFLWRRLHSLSGIFPIGAFLLEHYISNAFATNGGNAYNQQVRLLTSLPFVVWIEVFFIYIPLLYHSLYGFYIWYRGDSNVGAAYPWTGNWMYAAQRWTGAIAFFYMGYHTYTMRFSGVHLLTHSAESFNKVYSAFQNPWVVAFYIVGIVAASWHFAYGLWLFAAKWGITVGEGARRRFGIVCVGIGAVLIVIGMASMLAFLTGTPTTPTDSETSRLVHRF